MLTTPYKVLIACSSLLLLAALGYRVTDLLGGGSGGAPLVAVDRADEPADGGRSDGPLRPPPPRIDPPPASGDMRPIDATLAQEVPAPAPAPPVDAVDPAPGPEAEPAPEPEVPTLVIGRDPDQPRPTGPPPVASDPAVAPAGSEARVYVVQSGDTLQRIARRTLGDANAWSRISALNPGVDPLRLQLGDRLILPVEAAETNQASAATPAGEDASGGDGSVHRVQPGDSLSVIALRHYGDSTRWRAIYEANRDVMDGPDDLAIGTELQIPPRGDAGR